MADKLNGSVIVANTIPGTTIQSGTITIAQLDPAIANVVNTPLHPKISSLSYPGDDLAANTGGGDSIVINGSGFGTNVQVYINNNIVPSVVRNNANAVTITTAAQAPGTYLVTLINTDDGGTAILVPGIQYSGTPTWVTTSPLDQQQALSAWSISLSATGDSPIVYSLQAGSSLPDGITLAANGLISGTMTSPPAEDTTYNFTVLAIDPELQDTPKAFSVSVTVVVDPQFQYTTLLLQADGTNNGNNHAFLDSSNNNFTITRNGNVSQGSFSPFIPTGWSGYFDGNGDFINFTKQTTTGNFTCECWFFRGENVGGYHIVFGGANAGAGGADNIQLVVENNGSVNLVLNGSSIIGNAGVGSVGKNQWNHIAWVRSGSSCAIFVNGIRIGTGSSSAALNVDRIGTAGGLSAGTYDTRGYISNARITTTAVYDPSLTTCTVPTAPLTAITGTYLLTLQDNRIIDRSASPLTLTRNGDVSIQAFSPFATNIAYSPATHGGSAYFDGSGDWLTTPNGSSFAFGTGDFTIEGWFYLNGTTHGISDLSGGTTGYWLWNIVSGTMYWQSVRNVTNLITVSLSNYQNGWVHFAVVRNSGTTRIYQNGAQIASAADTTNYSGTAGNLSIGRESANPYVLKGYIADFRIVKGTAVYTTAFTPPTSPPSNIANTSLLLNFTNAQIYDAAAGSVLECVGDAKVNTSIKKYGAGSMVFDGNGDYLAIADTAQLKFGTGDFTVEAWVYMTATPSAQYAQIIGRTEYGTNGDWMFQIDNNRKPVMYINNGFVAVSSQAISLNTWTHIAASRGGGVLKLFVDGVQSNTVASVASTENNSSGVYTIGADQAGDEVLFAGYIDDLRISKGLARYRYNFTPPTRAFSTKGGTQTLTADEDFEYTTLLLSGNGTNNQNNHTFLDSSNNNFAITRFGNTTQGTFSPFSQTGWSNFFRDGFADFLTAPSNAAFGMGTGAWTIEGWFYTSKPLDQFSVVWHIGTINATDGMAGSLGSNSVGFRSNGQTDISAAVAISNQWTHIAWVKNSNTVTIYVNGAAVVSGNYTNSIATGLMTIGYNSTGFRFGGYISNLRVIKGTAVYTSAFTPPTAPLTDITNTSLLTCQSNRFIDNSSNAFAITRNGGVSVQAFSPFNPTAAWSAETNGGSAYFDGTGDYLSIPAGAEVNLISGDFTIELWFYPTASGTQRSLIQQGEASWRLNQSTGLKIEYAASGSLRITSSTDFVLNQWNHVALVQNGGTATLYLNGIASGTNASFRPSNSTANVAIGINTASVGNVWPFLGYIANARVVKGTAVYTSNFTLPTAPLTAITNTSLLTNFTNAGIYDATSKNVLETVGDAKISTIQSKFGGSSIAFDGTGDALSVPDSVNLEFGSEDFTIECWIYTTSATTRQTIFGKTNSAGQDASSSFILQIGTSVSPSSGILNFYHAAATTFVTSPFALSSNIWYHVAITRYGNLFTLYINGSAVVSATISTAMRDIVEPLYIGGALYGVGFVGYIQDFRITKGNARYAQNFIPPTTAFLTR